MRYGWKPGSKYTYNVKSNTQFDDHDEEIEGTVAYSVQSVDAAGVARVRAVSSFQLRQKDHDNFDFSASGEAGHSFASNHHSAFQQEMTVTDAPEIIVLDRQGKIISFDGGQNAPFPIGCMSHLPIESLPAGDESTWSIGGDVGITFGEGAAVPFGPPATGSGEPVLAREKTTYKVADKTGASIVVRKAYSFATVEQEKDEPRLSMTGDGELTFDRESGVFTSLIMSRKVILRGFGGDSALAAFVTCRLVGIEENKGAKR
jgi:hypothetical protein